MNERDCDCRSDTGGVASREPPWISVVISTRNRPDMAAACIGSILQNEPPDFELIVINQGSDEALAVALRECMRDSRLRYVRTETRGLSAGRNLGIRQARCDLIACTDDDCSVPADWLERMRAALMHDDRIAVVYGNVRPGAHNVREGFIPGCVRSASFVARSVFEEHRVDGMAGCLGLRRSAWERLGGFDEMLGAGSQFRAAEDLDYGIRALLAGFFVYASSDAEVTHHGFRSWREGGRLIEGYLYGIGAMIAKHLKCGNWGVLSYVAHLAWRWAVAGPVVEFGHQPPRWSRLRAFLQGGAAGMRQAVDRGRSLFRLDVRPPVES